MDLTPEHHAARLAKSLRTLITARVKGGTGLDMAYDWALDALEDYEKKNEVRLGDDLLEVIEDFYAEPMGEPRELVSDLLITIAERLEQDIMEDGGLDHYYTMPPADWLRLEATRVTR
jgi:hypothetical protein